MKYPVGLEDYDNMCRIGRKNKEEAVLERDYMALTKASLVQK